MQGKAYRLYVRNVKTGNWLLEGFVYQWPPDDLVKKYESFGLETRVEEYEADYDDR